MNYLQTIKRITLFTKKLKKYQFGFKLQNYIENERSTNIYFFLFFDNNKSIYM